MLQKEFEDRIGKKVSAEEYDAANRMYMSTELDKDVFCDLYTHHREALDIIVEQGKKIEELRNERAKTIDMIFDNANTYASSELRSYCIELIGARNYIRRMIEEERSLWQKDLDLIVSLL